MTHLSLISCIWVELCVFSCDDACAHQFTISDLAWKGFLFSGMSCGMENAAVLRKQSNNCVDFLKHNVHFILKITYFHSLFHLFQMLLCWIGCMNNSLEITFLQQNNLYFYLMRFNSPWQEKCRCTIFNNVERCCPRDHTGTENWKY